MSVRNALIAVARGDAPPRGALLQTCRLEADGAEHYGAEAIAAAFRSTPLDLADGSWIETDRGAAVIAPAGALVADVVEGRVARLWRPGEPVTAPSNALVAFDVDLAQAPAELILDAADFSGLSPAQLEDIAAAGRAIARGWRAGGQPAYRARPILLRAFAAAEGAAALFTLCWTAGGPVRTGGFTPVAAILPNGGQPQFAPDVTSRA